MKNYGEEEVLGVPREIVEDNVASYIEKYGLTAFWPIDADCDVLDNLGANSGFMLRNDAEVNVAFKQIIPYCLIVYPGSDGDVILHYSRAKENTPEARLSGKRSIGVGGHINPIDIDSSEQGDSYMNAVYRELQEEFGITKNEIQEIKTLGFVNDEENEVGQVHLGVVHAVIVNTPDIKAIEDHLVDAKFDTLFEIGLEQNLETWSQMIVEFFIESSYLRYPFSTGS